APFYLRAPQRSAASPSRFARAIPALAPRSPALQLLHLFMRCVLAAALTEFAELQTTGSCLLVLGRRIVPLFALAALQCHDLTHKNLPLALGYWPLAFALGQYLFLHPVIAARGWMNCRVALLNDLADGSGAYRPTAFTDSEAQAFLHCHRCDQLNRQGHVVSRHHHLRSRRQ